MSKPLDTRTVEYAYVSLVTFSPNLLIGYTEADPPVPIYKHVIRLQYELKDANKNLLRTTSLDHQLDSTGTDTVAAYVATLAAALDDLVLVDKLALSGYTP
jgi:hypothetical protein